MDSQSDKRSRVFTFEDWWKRSNFAAICPRSEPDNEAYLAAKEAWSAAITMDGTADAAPSAERLTSELKCQDGRPLLKELANIVTFLDSEDAHPSARIVEYVASFLGSLSGKYDRFDAGRQVEEPSEAYVLRLLGRIAHLERQLHVAEDKQRAPSSALPANDRALALLQRQKKEQHYDVDEWVELVREVERNCAAWHQATMTAGTLLGLPGGLGAAEFTAAVQQREREIRETHRRLLAEAKAEVAAESATSAQYDPATGKCRGECDCSIGQTCKAYLAYRAKAEGAGA